MPEWLSDAWVDETGGTVDLAAPFSALVQMTVTGTPNGDIRYHRVYNAGRVIGGAVGPAKGPDIALTLPLAEARQVLDGGLDLSVAFMQGRLKTAGDNGLLLGLLSGWSSPAGAASLARLRAAAGDG